MSDATLLLIVAAGMVVSASVVAAIRAATGKKRARHSLTSFQK